MRKQRLGNVFYLNFNQLRAAVQLSTVFVYIFIYNIKCKTNLVYKIQCQQIMTSFRLLPPFFDVPLPLDNYFLFLVRRQIAPHTHYCYSYLLVPLPKYLLY